MTQYLNLAKDACELKHLRQEVIKHFECKICTTLPVGGTTIVTTSCCNQLLGCRDCFLRATDDQLSCPLCRSEEVVTFPLRGFDQLMLCVAASNED